jgi:hypothetical protein
MAAVIGENGDSPAGKVVDEAIELAIVEESPYPETAMFLDADRPCTEREMARAESEGVAVVLVSADGSTKVISPEARGN